MAKKYNNKKDIDNNTKGIDNKLIVKDKNDLRKKLEAAIGEY